MRVVIFLFFIINSLQALNNQQIQCFKYSYKVGSKYQLGWTLAGIAYVESSLGKYNINLSDPSGSAYHILVTSVLHRLNIPNTSWNRSRMLERLIKDKNFASKQAISELLYWKSFWIQRGYSGKWLWVKMVGSYNGGYYSNIEYVRKVSKAIKYLRKINVNN